MPNHSLEAARLLAGPVFARGPHGDCATIDLTANRMRVAECEIVLRFGRTLAPRPQPFTRGELLADLVVQALLWLANGLRAAAPRPRPPTSTQETR